MEPKQAGPFAADKIELHHGAWERFRQAVHVMAKAGPQHRIGGAAVKSGQKIPKAQTREHTTNPSSRLRQSRPKDTPAK
jgi:hypothetical protein